MAAELRVVIVGVGSIGERHLRCFAKTGRVQLACCEVNGALRDRIGSRYKVPAHQDLDELFADPPQAAVICTPAHLHVPIALRLAEAGVHLLIEKPLSTTTEGVQRLGDIVQQKQLVAAVAYVNRLHPVLAEMRAALSAGRLGKLVQLVVNSGQHFPHYRPAYRTIYYNDRRTGGGAIQDALTHYVNLGEWLVGPIGELAADAAHQVLDGVSVEDTAHVIARHGRVLASYSLNQYQAANESSITVVGEAGTAQFLAHENCWQTMSVPDAGWQRYDGPPLGRDDLFVRQAEMFLDAVTTGAPVACSLRDAQQTLAVNLAIQQAVETKQWQPVRG